jgi:hypothetical protein
MRLLMDSASDWKTVHKTVQAALDGRSHRTLGVKRAGERSAGRPPVKLASTEEMAPDGR